MILYVPIVDLTTNLAAFCARVGQTFHDNGLLKIKYGKDLAGLPLHAKILNWTAKLPDGPNADTTLRNGRWKRPMSARIDAVPLLAKYDTHVWVENVPLERLVISELGMKRRKDPNRHDDRYYKDIACVPLPGMQGLQDTP